MTDILGLGEIMWILLHNEAMQKYLGFQCIQITQKCRLSEL